jgi:hypothetical protein
LALHHVRRGVERWAAALLAVGGAPMAVIGGRVVRALRELVAALDRRIPHVERPAEASIARDAAALKKKALARIEEIESDGLDDR